MGAGFYAMVVASILIARVAEAEKRRGWLWAGINCCISVILGKYFGLDVLMAVGGFLLTFFIMFFANILFPKKLE
jgi:hypothetical protein